MSSNESNGIQRRRYTITTAAQQKNEYPEHLNPFREGNDEAKPNNKYSSTLGRRNSRLTASLRLKSWFPSKSSKPDESDTETQTPAKPKEKFTTLTPKISRQIKDVFTRSIKRSYKNKADGVGPLAPIPQYVPSTTTTTSKPNADHRFVGEEFKLAPRASRERFATLAAATPTATPATEGLQPPVPLPRTILPKAEPKNRVDETMQVCSASAADNSAATCSHTLNISEDDGSKYVRQGARPKKKRQAPLPPAKTTLPAPDSCSSSKLTCTTSTTELSETVSLSESINSDCPSPSPSCLASSDSHVMEVVQPSSSSSPQPPQHTSRTTEDNNDDRLV